MLMTMELEELKHEIIRILKKHDVCRAAIFGSFATREEQEESDLDILIEFEAKAKKSLLDLAALKIELEELLGRKVDVVEYSTLHPLLREKILEEQKVIL